MALIFLAMAAGACLAEKVKIAVEMNEDRKRRLAVDTYRKNGVSPFALSKSDVMHDWRRERRLFPAPVAAYLERNPRALDEYAGAISRDTVNDAAGTLPVPARKNTGRNDYVFMYKPELIAFFKRYFKKIRVYNNTGVMYY